MVNTKLPSPPCTAAILIGDFTVVASKSTLLPGVRIGAHVFISAQSLVGCDVPDHKMVSGIPAKIMGDASMLRMKNDVRVKAYPWHKRFFRGYPEEIVCRWREEP